MLQMITDAKILFHGDCEGLFPVKSRNVKVIFFIE
jgi:hypothetical protein